MVHDLRRGPVLLSPDAESYAVQWSRTQTQNRPVPKTGPTKAKRVIDNWHRNGLEGGLGWTFVLGGRSGLHDVVLWP